MKMVKLLSGKNKKMHTSDIYRDGAFKQVKQAPAYTFDKLSDGAVDSLLRMSRKAKK